MGSGAGKSRRANVAATPTDSFRWAWRFWHAFLLFEDLEETKVGEYYGIDLEEQYKTTLDGGAARCAVASEILSDLVATRAFQLPDGVEIGEFSFSVDGLYMMMHRETTGDDGYEQKSTRHCIYASDSYLHDQMKMGGKPMEKIFRSLADSVTALVS